MPLDAAIDKLRHEVAAKTVRQVAEAQAAPPWIAARASKIEY